MLRSSRRLPISLFALRCYRHSFSTVKALPFKPVKNNIWGKLALGCGMLLSLGYVHMIEDETIRNIKSIMSRQVSLLKG